MILTIFYIYAASWLFLFMMREDLQVLGVELEYLRRTGTRDDTDAISGVIGRFGFAQFILVCICVIINLPLILIIKKYRGM